MEQMHLIKLRIVVRLGFVGTDEEEDQTNATLIKREIEVAIQRILEKHRETGVN